MVKGNITCYSCMDDNCEPLETSGLCRNAFACWQAADFMPDGKQQNIRGCVMKRIDKPNVHCGYNIGLIGKNYDYRCCMKDLCNSVPFPILERPPTVNPGNNNRKLLATILTPLIGLILIICGITYIYYRTKRPERNRTIPTNNFSCEIRAPARGDSTTKYHLLDHNVTSGSGSGLPMLVQRTLAQQVTLEECLSSGAAGFGRQIWRGRLQGEHVAVKVFCTRDEAAWARETEVYNRLLSSSHENILGYIGSDVVGQAGFTELWLVSHYHEPGSLYNYLGQLSQQLSHRQMIDLCLSVTNGLLYLHGVIEGTHKKLAMAHRNLCSKSIIVKTNGTCAIADLAHVVTEDRLDAAKLDFERLSKRYMSPELLELTCDLQLSLESFRRGDIYSLGLVFWEVCWCCIDKEVALGYAAPYSEWLVNGDQEPTLEEMRKLVVTDQRRPSISNCWYSNPTLVRMKALMEECWYTNAAARLPILRVKKTLGKIAANIPNIGSA